ncbi:MAG: thioredoxin family protein [bacterium]|nr:thioredoxin family protein [bacterium]
MNKKVIVLVVAIIIAIGGSMAYLLASPADNTARLTTSDQNNEAPKQEQPAENSQDPVSSQSGAYVNYSPDIIASTTGTKLLFFHAPWCPQCRDLEADIKSKGVPAGVAIIKVDYDTSQSLRQKYGVTLQTTVVKVSDNGDLVDKFVAYDNPTIDAIKVKLL